MASLGLSIALASYIVADTVIWPSGTDVTFSAPADGSTVSVTATGTGSADTVTFEAGGNYVINLTGTSLNTTLNGYGTFGNGSTSVTVKGGNAYEPDTHVTIYGFADIGTLSIDDNAVVTISPGVYMNGNQTHDQAGHDGAETSAGVLIDTIYLGYGTLIMDNVGGFLFDNSGYIDGTLQEGKGYTVYLNYDLSNPAAVSTIMLGSNMRSLWARLDGDEGGTGRGIYRSLIISGNAREFAMSEVGVIEDIQNLTLAGGQISFNECGNAVHGNLTIGSSASVTLNGDNILAAGSGVLSVSGELHLGSTAQTLTGTNRIELHNGVIAGIGTSHAEKDEDDGLVLKYTEPTEDFTDPDHTVDLVFSGTSNSVSADVHIDGGVTLNISSSQSTDVLNMMNNLCGAGDIVISGPGMVNMGGDDAYFSGSVTVIDGGCLSLNSTTSLSGASYLTIGDGSALYLNAGGNGVSLKELHVGSFAELVLRGAESTIETDASEAGITVENIAFVPAGSFEVIFDETCRTMAVYNLLLTKNPIMNVENGTGKLLAGSEDNPLGSLAGLNRFEFFMTDASGNLVRLEYGEYEVGFEKQEDGSYLLYVGTLMGNVWTNGSGDSLWNEESANWRGDWDWRADNGQGAFTNTAYNQKSSVAGMLYNDAIFRNLTDADGNTIASQNITIQGTVSPEAIYIENTPESDGSTTAYTFAGGAIAGGTQIHKRGDSAVEGVVSTVEFKGVQAGGSDNPLGWVTVSGGQMKLSEGTVFRYNGAEKIQIDSDAALVIDSTSSIISRSGASVTGYGAANPAVLSGFNITDDAITGGNTAENTGISSITDAVISGYTVSGTLLSGTGNMTGGGIGENVVLTAGSTYTLNGHIVMNSALTAQEGSTVIIGSGSTYDISSLVQDAGNGTYTIDLVTGAGNVVVGGEGYNFARDFYYNGVNLDSVKGLSVEYIDGVITLTMTSVSAVAWDTDWGLGDKAPAFGTEYSKTADNAMAFYGDSAYLYSNIVDGGSAKMTVAVIQGGGNATESVYTSILAGGTGNGTVEQDIWILDEGSDFWGKIGGLYKSSYGSDTLWGDTHLYITGAGTRTNTEVYGGSYNVVQHGDVYVSIQAGGYQNIYGGSRNADLYGNVHLRLEGGQLNTYFDGSTWTADQVANLSSAAAATAANIYANKGNYGGIFASGVDWNNGGIDTKVLGNADVYLGSGFTFSDNLARIDGQSAYVSGVSTLHITDGVKYSNLNAGVQYAQIQAVDGSGYLDTGSDDIPFIGKFTSVEIRGFDVIELAEGSWLSIQADRFNMDTDVTLKGKGTIELTAATVWQDNCQPFDEKDSEQDCSLTIPTRSITVTEGATLKISTNKVTAWNAAPTNRFDILIKDTGTLDMSSWQTDKASATFLVDVWLEGDGCDGKGAVYKGYYEHDVNSGSQAQFQKVTLTGNASVGVYNATPVYMKGADDVYDNDSEGTYLGDSNQSELNLNGYTLTLQGGGTLGLVNTTIDSGTLNVLDGTLSVSNRPDHTHAVDENGVCDITTHHITYAKQADIVLSASGTLHTDLNNNASTNLKNGKQTLQMASLSGEGRVELTEYGINNIEMVVVRSEFYDDFMDSSASHWNSSGYGYAVFSGTILGDKNSVVSKSGDGVQYFSGSESDYGGHESTALGGTYVAAGTLYLLGTSHFSESEGNAFVKGSTKVGTGVVGSGSVHWTGYVQDDAEHVGQVYLGDGVRIGNAGSYFTNTSDAADGGDKLPENMYIGVEAVPNGSALADFVAEQSENQVREGYCLIDTHALKSLSVNGVYLDGTAYVAGQTIDRNLQLYVAEADIAGAVVHGFGVAGYSEAAWSGVLQGSGNLVKVGGGTLVLDQTSTYTGSTQVQGGTLRLRGWAEADSMLQTGLLMSEGTSLMLSYDGTYTDAGWEVSLNTMAVGECNEVHSITRDMALTGTGDARWTLEDETDGETAALISDVAAGVVYTISGVISGEGNLLHSGDGTLVLSGADTYTGGTVVTRGHVYAAHDTALGATASGADSARVVTWGGSHLHFTDGVNSVIAAPTANSIEGSVYIGDEGGSAATRLTMTGNGYWAENTVLSHAGTTLLFSGERASNFSETAGDGAGVLTGNGTTALSDAAAPENTLTVEFAAMNNYTGSVVVEGDGALLQVSETTSDSGNGHDYVVKSGVTEQTGRVAVSGQGAHFSAEGADITVASGGSMALTSTGTDSDSAKVTAGSVRVASGATYSVTKADTTYAYADTAALMAAASVDAGDILTGYGNERGNTVALDGSKGYGGHYDSAVAVNQSAVGTAAVGSFTLEGGSTYAATEANTSLAGGSLTLDISGGSLINLSLKTDYAIDIYNYRQIVLFSEVQGVSLVTGEQTQTLTFSGDLYYTDARNYLTGDYIDDGVYLVYDSAAGIVYLDIPEPTAATLSLLALAALAARRRRR